MSKPTRHRDAQWGEQLNKSFIVGTMCGIALMVTFTICRNSWVNVVIPEQLSQLSTLIIGIVGGWLGKTGVDAVAAARRATDAAADVPGATTATATFSQTTVPPVTDGKDEETKSE